MRCPICGTDLEAHKRVCPECGAIIKVSETDTEEKSMFEKALNKESSAARSTEESQNNSITSKSTSNDVIESNDDVIERSVKYNAKEYNVNSKKHNQKKRKATSKNTDRALLTDIDDIEDTVNKTTDMTGSERHIPKVLDIPDIEESENFINNDENDAAEDMDEIENLIRSKKTASADKNKKNNKNDIVPVSVSNDHHKKASVPNDRYKERTPEIKQSTKRQNKKSRKCALIFVFVILAALAGFCVFRFVPAPINLSNYTNVSYVGPNGYAKANISINEDELANKIEKVMIQKGAKADVTVRRDAEDLAASCKASINSKKALSNGDIFDINYVSDKDAAAKHRIRFSSKPYTVTVEGLKKAESYDPFKFITISYTGMNGKVKAAFENTAKDTVGKSLKYEFDGKYNDLKIGDKVTLKCISDSIVGNAVLASKEKTYKVDTSDKLITDTKQITPETLSALQKVAVSTLTNKYSSKYYCVGQWKYFGNYLLVRKDGEKNKVYLVYGAVISPTVKATDKAHYFKPVTVYTYVSFDTLILHTNGVVTGAVSTAQIPKDTVHLRSSSLVVNGYASINWLYRSAIKPATNWKIGYTDTLAKYSK